LKTLYFKCLIFSIFIATSGVTVAQSKGQKTAEFKPKPGFSPVVWSETLDPEKEEYIRKEIGAEFKKTRPFVMSSALIKKWHLNADSILKARILADSTKYYASLTLHQWRMDAVYVDAFGPPELSKGRWIKFYDNLTFEYGYYTTISGKGKYYYNPNEETLLLNDQDKNVKPLEFTIMWENDYIVLEGTKIFDDTDLNIKLVRTDKKPVKE
jgi:hypothetical protein